MGGHKICRVCLIHGVKMYDCTKYLLKDYYEEIMDEDMMDELPQHFCYECAAMLFKCYKFKEKCFVGLNKLRIICEDGDITPQRLSNVDRSKLQSSIDIIQVSKRVKNCKYKHLYPLKNMNHVKNESEETDDEKIVNGKDKKVHNEITDVKEIIINETFQHCDDNDVIDDINIFDDNDKIEKNIEIEQTATKTNIKIEKEVVSIEVDSELETKDHHHLVSDDIMMVDDEEKLNTSKTKNEIEAETTKLNIDSDKSDSESDWPLTEHKKAKPPLLPDLQNKTKKVTNKNKNTKKSNNETGTILKKKKVNSNDETGTIEKKLNFEYPKHSELNPKHWHKSLLTEEEAIAEFQAKGNNPIYLSRQYQCEFCFKGFKEKSTWERHMKITHCESRGSQVCRFCKSRYRIKHYLNKHLQKHFLRIKCLRCDYVCNAPDFVAYHERMHSGVLTKCDHCGLQFAHSSTYYTHLRKYHRTEHVCRLCGESFVSKLGLNKHTKLKHILDDVTPAEDDDKGNYCETCDIKFETVSAYTEHFKQSAKHTNDNEQLKDKRVITELEKQAGVPLRRFGKTQKTCFKCALSFRHHSDFVQHHLSEHKGIPMESPRIRGSNIRGKPKPYLPSTMCEICGVTMKSASIEHHMKIKHTRQELLACSTCGREFASPYVLERHQLVHTGERPYPCRACDKRFKAIGAMKLHYRTFHLKEPYPKRDRRKKTKPE